MFASSRVTAIAARSRARAILPLFPKSGIVPPAEGPGFGVGTGVGVGGTDVAVIVGVGVGVNTIGVAVDVGVAIATVMTPFIAVPFGKLCTWQ